MSSKADVEATLAKIQAELKAGTLSRAKLNAERYQVLNRLGVDDQQSRAAILDGLVTLGILDG